MKTTTFLLILAFWLGICQQVVAQWPKDDNAFSTMEKTGVITGEGLTGRYYQGYAIDSLGHISFSGLTEVFSRVDSLIAFWNGNRFYRWEPVAGWGNNYSVGWEGFIFIEQAGEYGFGTMSDDGSQVFIDSSLVVDNGEGQWFDWEDNISEGDTSGTPFLPLFLDEGFHEISVRFYENASYDGIELWWLKPGQDSSDIPYYGTNFHGIPPTFNDSTNWELVPKSVLYPAVPVNITDPGEFMPRSVILHQNYPNPFNGETIVGFSLAVPQSVRLQIFDLQGRMVKTLIDQYLPAGEHQAKWIGVNRSGKVVASGVYVYRLATGDTQLLRKLLYIK